MATVYALSEVTTTNPDQGAKYWKEPTLAEGAVAVVRGCGVRKLGGVYIECGLGVKGCPVEHFILDPPQVVDPQRGFPLPMQGMGMIVDPAGTWHLVDRVGQAYYPFPVDFIEETRHFGLSRRVQKSLKAPTKDGPKSGFALLTKKSRILIVHDRGSIVNWQDYENQGVDSLATDEYTKHGGDPGWTCPKQKDEHHPKAAEECCAGLWWEDLPNLATLPDVDTQAHYGLYANLKDKDDPRAVCRDIPWNWGGKGMAAPTTTYLARMRPKGVDPIYAGPAIIASFPISRIVVVVGNTLEMENAATLTSVLAGCQLPVVAVPK